MKLSVVIPAYNEESFIAGTIEALQNQTVKPDEIIVVDNNSFDRTGDIARSMGAQVIVERKRGITPARNRGFNAATGDIIARCDSDTRPYPNWVELIKKSFESSDIVGVTGTNVFYDAPIRYKKFLETSFTKVYFIGNKLLLGHEAFYGSNMAILRNVWIKSKKNMCLDDKLVHEDIDLAIHIAPFGIIAYNPDLIVGCSYRAFKVPKSVMVARLVKWPKTKAVHTNFGKYVKASKRTSSTTDNLIKK
jgi:glycosyltransferase involved in cell wall biosynthesis